MKKVLGGCSIPEQFHYIIDVEHCQEQKNPCTHSRGLGEEKTVRTRGRCSGSGAVERPTYRQAGRLGSRNRRPHGEAAGRRPGPRHL